MTGRTRIAPQDEAAPTGGLVLAEGVLDLEGGLPLRLGGRIDPCRVSWRLLGAADAPVVAVLGGISADRRVCATPGADEPPGWWEKVVGVGRGLDLARWRVLSIDYLAGPGASTGIGADGVIPPLTPADQAEALRRVADHLALPKLRAVMGASYGGATALAFAADHAERVRAALVMGSAHRTHPHATALRVVQRRIVTDALARGEERAGLALARALAMTTYRSPEEFQHRFDGEAAETPAGWHFPVEDYLDHHGRVFAERFDARGFICLSQSMDLHSVDPARVAVPVTLVGMEPDAIAPLWQMRELLARLGPGHALVEVRSLSGHDAFLTDVEAFSSIVREFLDSR
jgi:homoserine O-acetyltransferase